MQTTQNRRGQSPLVAVGLSLLSGEPLELPSGEAMERAVSSAHGLRLKLPAFLFGFRRVGLGHLHTTELLHGVPHCAVTHAVNSVRCAATCSAV